MSHRSFTPSVYTKQSLLLIAILFSLTACGASKQPTSSALEDPKAQFSTVQKEQEEISHRLNALEQRVLNLAHSKPPSMVSVPVVASTMTQTTTQAPATMQAPMPSSRRMLPILPSPDADIAAGKYRLIDPSKPVGTLTPMNTMPTLQAMQPMAAQSTIGTMATMGTIHAMDTHATILAMTLPTSDQDPVKSLAQALAKKSAPMQKMQPKPMEMQAAQDSVEAQYMVALEHYRNQYYQKSMELFDLIIKKYPNHSLMTNSLYWFGECLYATGRDIDAIFAFKNITNKYPQHPKAPDALLKTVLSYERIGDRQNALAHLNLLFKDYPNSPAVQRAKQLGLTP